MAKKAWPLIDPEFSKLPDYMPVPWCSKSRIISSITLEASHGRGEVERLTVSTLGVGAVIYNVMFKDG